MRSPAGALVREVAMPLKTVSSQRRNNDLAGTRLLSGRINIFNAQQPTAIVGFRLEIARNRRDQRAKVERTSRRRREPAYVWGLFARLHRLSELPVPVVPIPKLPFSEFTTFLGLQAQGRYRARFEAFESDFLTRFITKTVRSVVDSGQCGVDFAE